MIFDRNLRFPSNTAPLLTQGSSRMSQPLHRFHSVEPIPVAPIAAAKMLSRSLLSFPSTLLHVLSSEFTKGNSYIDEHLEKPQ
jgi:hypothetical protein